MQKGKKLGLPHTTLLYCMQVSSNSTPTPFKLVSITILKQVSSKQAVALVLNEH